MASQDLRVLPTHETRLSPTGRQPGISEARVLIIIIITIIITITIDTAIIIVLFIFILFYLSYYFMLMLVEDEFRPQSRDPSQF